MTESGNEMIIYDFCYLCTDDSVIIRIFDMNENVEEEVFSGSIRDAMLSEFAEFEVESFGVAPQEGITLNIDSSDE